MRLKLWLDPLLLIPAALASLLGLIMLSSVSPDRLPAQLFALGLSSVLMFFLASQESIVFRSFTPIAYLFSLLLLVATLVLATITRGTLSWLDIGGFRFQPSELSKPILLLAFAYFLERFPPLTLRNIILNLLIYLVPTVLIVVQPDLGTALVITSIFLTQLFLARLPWRYVFFMLLLGLLILPLLPHILRDYQYARLTTFLDPFADPLGSGYNVIQSMIAVGSGNIWGKGLGQGTQSHLRFLPERHTDFAYASLAEELGLFGSLAILAIIGTLVFRLLSAATHESTRMPRLILGGAAMYFAFQSLLNLGMNTGIAPITGITLPLISYGGTSILATGLILGISSSVIRDRKLPPLLEIR